MHGQQAVSIVATCRPQQISYQSANGNFVRHLSIMQSANTAILPAYIRHDPPYYYLLVKRLLARVHQQVVFKELQCYYFGESQNFDSRGLSKRIFLSSLASSSVGIKYRELVLELLRQQESTRGNTQRINEGITAELHGEVIAELIRRIITEFTQFETKSLLRKDYRVPDHELEIRPIEKYTERNYQVRV